MDELVILCFCIIKLLYFLKKSEFKKHLSDQFITLTVVLSSLPCLHFNS